MAPPAELWGVISCHAIGVSWGRASTSSGRGRFPLTRSWGGPASEPTPRIWVPRQSCHGRSLCSACSGRRAGGGWGPRPSATLSVDRELYSGVINPASCRRTNHFSKKEDSGFQCLMTYYEVQPRGKNHLKNIERHLPARAPSTGGNIDTRFI